MRERGGEKDEVREVGERAREGRGDERRGRICMW